MQHPDNIIWFYLANSVLQVHDLLATFVYKREFFKK